MKLYTELASWWPLLSPVTDYAGEAEFFARVFAEAGLPPAPSLLELGSGGGSNAFYLKKMFSPVALTDISSQMLAVSRKLNPECEHLQGDMRNERLGRTFDAVFVHDAIDYMTTPYDLRRAMETALVHCKPGGVAMFVPDHVRETFESATEHGGNDGADRALRYLEWTYDPDEKDTTYTVEYVYLLRQGNNPVQVEYEQHLCGLFARSEWLQYLNEVGFQVQVIRDPFERDLFVRAQT